MTAFPWHNASDEIETAALESEPSHVHIPRPSLKRSRHADTSVVDDGELVLVGCARGDD